MKYSLIIITTLTALLYANVVNAQQEPQFTQNMFYTNNWNPGFAGNENAIAAVGAYRYQWAGFKDAEGNHVAPETFFVNLCAPVKILRGGLSGVVISDELGFEKTVTVKLGYAYQRKIGFGKLGIGVQADLHNRIIDFAKFKAVDKSDPVLLGGEQSDMLIDFSFGVFYKVPGSYYFGLSGVNLLESEGAPLTSTSGSGGVRLNLDRTFYLEGGYDFVFPSNPAIAILPSVLIKTNMSSLQMDIAALVKYKEAFWAGMSYRLQDAVSLMAGVQYKDIKIGYSYDIIVSSLNLSVTGGSHEVMLGYSFKLETERGRTSYKNTRFL